MEKVKTELFKREEIERGDGSIIPAGEWERTSFRLELHKSSDPFLQKFLDAGARIFEWWGFVQHLRPKHPRWMAYIYQSKEQNLVILVRNSLILIRIHRDHTILIDISTYEDKRREGSARFIIELLARIADETDTTLTLTLIAPDIGDYGLTRIPQNLAIPQQIKPEERIPPEKLEALFEKVGFRKGGKYSFRDPGYIMRTCRNMQRLPLQK